MKDPFCRSRVSRAVRRFSSALGSEQLERRALLTASVLVSPVRLTTSEDGGGGVFAVSLGQAPTADVVVPINSTNPAEGVPSVASLTFTPADWRRPQAVRVTGVPDGVRDGARQFTVVVAAAESSDPAYAGVDGRDVAVTNLDSRKLVAGAVVTPVAGLRTSEDGAKAAFSVKLTYRPTHDVTIPLSSSNPGEGVPAVDRLVFTPANWSTPQAVTVSGVADGVRDGNKAYRIVTGPATSDDPRYNGLDVADVAAVNRDSTKLVAGVKVWPVAGLVTTPSGGSDYFNMVLTFKPSAAVTIPVASSNNLAGVTNSSEVTFTPENWNMLQQVVVTGRGGSFVGRDVLYSVVTGRATSADPRYQGMNPSDVSVRNRAPTDIGRFAGPYEGQAWGTVTLGGIRRSVRFMLSFEVKGDNTIELHDPETKGPIGSGHVLPNSGAITMRVDKPASAFYGATFVGSFSIADMRVARGTWKWTPGGATATGMWNVVRIGGVSPAG